MTKWTWKLRTAFGAVLIGIIGTGCQSTTGKSPSLVRGGDPPVALARKETQQASPYAVVAHKPGLLAPKMELEWSIVSGQKQNIPVMSGFNTIGPDGTLVLGPYGTFPIAGLTLEQASLYIEKQLQPFVINPKVGLKITKHAQGTLTTQNYSGITSNPDWSDSEVTTVHTKLPLPGKMQPVSYSSPGAKSYSTQNARSHYLPSPESVSGNTRLHTSQQTRRGPFAWLIGQRK